MKRRPDRQHGNTTLDLIEYLMCPDVYYGAECGDGHTPEMVDQALQAYEHLN